MHRITMKALKYQSVPLGNERSYVDKDGEFFVTSEEDAAAREARGLAERASSKGSEAEGEGENDGQNYEAETDLSAKPWTMQVDEETYLSKWPDGPHAEHAKARLGKKSVE